MKANNSTIVINYLSPSETSLCKYRTAPKALGGRSKCLGDMHHEWLAAARYSQLVHRQSTPFCDKVCMVFILT